MALSRSMKNLMHDAAQARRGGGNPSGPAPGMLSGADNLMAKAARDRAGGTKPTPGGTGGTRGPVMTPGGGKIRPPMGRGGRNPVTGGPGLPPRVGPKPPRGRAQIAVPGGRMPRGGVMGGPAGGGKPMPRGGTGGVVGPTRPGAGTFGFAARGGGGTPALQKATAGARSQVQAMRQRAAGPAALAKPRGQSVASRIGGRQGPPARGGGMARALGSGGSRRRMLR